jgi:WD40 repeat protein
MGQVYRARDARLRRDVAVKILHPSLAKPQYIERLSREARAAASLNHPNIVAVYDVCIEGAAPYIVSELLEGESLRERLDRGPIPYRKALEFGIQIAQALAAAHGKNIYHRDLKPANVFITSDGHVKLLDFGLAKVHGGEPAADSSDPTASDISRPGVAIGTVGYMAPEQVVGGPVDHRTDIFAFGALLYEMLTGIRAFHRSSPVETMNAVLHEEPPDLLTANPNLPSAAAAVVRRCLEKNREERFQSARDLAFHLRQLEQSTTGVHAPPPRRVRLLPISLGIGVLACIPAVLWVLFKPSPSPVFEQLAFHRGRIGGARFASQAVVYSQAPAGGPLETWLSLADGPESRSLGYKEADVLAARTNEVALSLHRRFVGGERFIGTLARAPLGGGTPREILKDVEDADWDASGTRFAVARSAGLGAGSQLEYPIGRVLYHTLGSIHSPRISRDGQRVAFLEDPAGLGVGGRLLVAASEGDSKVLPGAWASARGLAWSPKGDEIWFTAAEVNSNRTLRAIDLSGRERLVFEGPGSLTLWDVAPDGRVLLTRDDKTRSIVGVAPGSTAERDLSWFDTDTTGLAALSRDGQWLLFGDRFGIYTRRTNGDPAVKLGLEGAWADDLSPDGNFVLATSASTDQLLLVPTGAGGDTRPLKKHQIQSYSGAFWFPDGRRILFNGREADHKLRSYVMDLVGGAPRALTSEGTWALSVSPDGALAAAIGPGQGISLWPTAGGPPRSVRGSEPNDRPVGWTADGGSLWVFKRGEMPANICRLEIASGARRPWKKIAPPDLAGVYSLVDFYVTPTGQSYFYSFERVLSQLYVARRLR